MPYDHSVPVWDVNILRVQPLRLARNNVVDGTPIYGATSRFDTSVFPATLPSARLPVVSFDRKVGCDMWTSLALPFTYSKAWGLSGKELIGESMEVPIVLSADQFPDRFECTPKIHCGIDFGVDDGSFVICVSLDLLTVFDQLRSTFR